MFVPPVILTTIPQLTTIVTTIISALSKISPAVNLLVARMPIYIDKVKPIAETIFEMMQILGEFQKSTAVQSLGEKVASSEESGVSLDDSNDISEYSKKIEELDAKPEVSENLTVEGSHTAALALMVSMLEVKYGTSVVDLVALAGRNPEFFNAERLSSYLKLCDKSELTVNDISDYFSSSFNRKESANVENLLMRAEANLQAGEDYSSIIGVLKLERE